MKRLLIVLLAVLVLGTTAASGSADDYRVRNYRGVPGQRAHYNLPSYRLNYYRLHQPPNVWRGRGIGWGYPVIVYPQPVVPPWAYGYGQDPLFPGW